MPTEKITKQAVERLEPGAADGYLWDSEQKGFGVKVTPKGRRIYLCSIVSTAGGEPPDA